MHCSKCSQKETCNMCKSLELDTLDPAIEFTCYAFDIKDMEEIEMLTNNEIIKSLEHRIDNFSKSVLDLLKQKDTEIGILIRKKETLRDEIAEKQAEIERLEADCEKQYEIAEASIRANIADGGTSCHWCIDSTKAEARKEFAERLKEKAEYYSDLLFKTVDVEEVDNLLAEMESERE